MKREAILVVDLGSTSVKSTVFSPDGQVLARAGGSYPTRAPHPAWAEQEPERWWEATVRATRTALREAVTAGRQDLSVAAIGLTGQMHGVVALDRDGAVLGPCLTVQDRRAADDVAAIDEELGPGRSYAITGARLDPASPAAKLRWLARHQPQVSARAAVFLSPKDYLRYRLTGEPATDPIDAAGTLLYDLRAQAWSPELCRAARIAVDQLPPIRPAHSLAGMLVVEAAAALGLPVGVPVAIGAGDDVECLGAGLRTSGQAVEHLGTTGSILAASSQVVIDAAMRVDCYPHAIPGLYLVGGSTGSAGATLAWAARQLVMADDRGDGGHLHLEDGPTDDEQLVVFLPYLSGERCPVWDPKTRGLLAGLTLGTTNADIARAVFAGVGFSLRHILDTLLDLGLRIDEIVASSDATEAGTAWPLLRSTIYGRPLLLPGVADATALGTLILTLVAAELQPSIEAAAGQLVPPPERRIMPDAERRERLEDAYTLYRELSSATMEVFSRRRNGRRP